MRDTKTFAYDFLQDVLATAQVDIESTENVFVEKFCEYLVDADEVFDFHICNYRKSRKSIKINAYEYTDDLDVLSIFVADFDKLSATRKVNEKNVIKSLNHGLNFYKNSIKGFKDQLEESNKEVFEFSDIIEKNTKEIRKLKIYLITNGIAENIIPPDEQIGNVKVSYYVWDIERLFQFLHEKKGQEVLKVNFEEDFKERLQLIKVPFDNPIYDCYVGVLSGELLASVYDLWGQRLIEKNVRSFLQARGKINRGLRDTIANDPYMFMAYNNGISTVADEALLEPSQIENLFNIKELVGWQIVNGGQTTASLYQAKKNNVPLENIFVQIKLTVIKTEQSSEEMTASISKYANSQNKISVSDLSANDPFQVAIEKLSRTIWVPSKGKGTTKWFYERARGQYLVEVNRQGTPSRKKTFQNQNPQNQVIKKTEVAKYEMSWRQHPHIVSKGSETNFFEFIETMKEDSIIPDATFYKEMIAKGILFKAVDKIVKDLDFGGYKANIVTYSIAYFAHINQGHLNFINIWEKQKVEEDVLKQFSQIANFVFEHITDTPPENANVTQWCKKTLCWETLKKKKYPVFNSAEIL